MKKIILASASPRRRAILSNVGVEYDVFVPGADEACVKYSGDPALYVQELALLKASAACGELIKGGEKGHIIIGADTIVEADGKILGKPKDAQEAQKMLKMLSAREHNVYTGVCVMNQSDANAVCRSVCTAVEFYELSDSVINAYIATNEPMDKAGAYGIQGKGTLLVKGIRGDYFNVVGLPVSALAKILEDEFGIKII